MKSNVYCLTHQYFDYWLQPLKVQPIHICVHSFMDIYFSSRQNCGLLPLACIATESTFHNIMLLPCSAIIDIFLTCLGFQICFLEWFCALYTSTNIYDIWFVDFTSLVSLNWSLSVYIEGICSAESEKSHIVRIIPSVHFFRFYL